MDRPAAKTRLSGTASEAHLICFLKKLDKINLMNPMEGEGATDVFKYECSNRRSRRINFLNPLAKQTYAGDLQCVVNQTQSGSNCNDSKLRNNLQKKDKRQLALSNNRDFSFSSISLLNIKEWHVQ